MKYLNGFFNLKNLTMTKKAFVKKESIIWLIITAQLVYLLVVWDKLPDQVPVHFNISGEADNWGAKWIPSVMVVGIYLLLLVLPKIDPRWKNYNLFSATYYKFRLFLTLLFSVIAVSILANQMGMDFNLGRVVSVSVLVLLTLIGNYLSTLKPNWFIGIRLPWTLDSESNWRKTHKLAGRLWFWLGLATLVASFFLPVEITGKIMVAVVAVMVIVPIVYSFIVFKKEKALGNRNS